MSKLKKERLNQMIENALTYKQVSNPSKSYFSFRSWKDLFGIPNAYALTFATFIISFIFITPAITLRNLADFNEINDYITYEFIEDL